MGLCNSIQKESIQLESKNEAEIKICMPLTMEMASRSSASSTRCSHFEAHHTQLRPCINSLALIPIVLLLMQNAHDTATPQPAGPGKAREESLLEELAEARAEAAAAQQHAARFNADLTAAQEQNKQLQQQLTEARVPPDGHHISVVRSAAAGSEEVGIA